MGRRAAGDGRARRGWGAKLAVGGLLAAAGPLAIAGPASAARINETSTVSLTFVPNGGGVVTCRLDAEGSHETSSSNGFVLGQSGTKLSDGNFATICRGNHTITIRYRDRDENKTYTSFAYDTDTAYARTSDGDVSGISIEHTVLFLGCNPGASASCTLTTTTSPK